LSRTVHCAAIVILEAADRSTFKRHDATTAKHHDVTIRNCVDNVKKFNDKRESKKKEFEGRESDREADQVKFLFRFFS
jgi:hypothetical protein